MSENNFHNKGLTNEQVLQSRLVNGSNVAEFKKENALLDSLVSLIKEPMIILLLVASTVYFLSGNTGDGIFLSSAIVLVSAISLFQESRSKNALEKLKEFTQPFCKVIRDSKTLEIKSSELVLGDCIVVSEGTFIPADGKLIHSTDFSVNESVLTGESLAVNKDILSEDNFIYQGTTVVTGIGIAEITAIGNKTKLGNIAKSLENIKEEKTPLELQISHFVKIMVIIGAIVFVLVWLINYLHFKNVLDSLIKSLTLAMSILPEEIPVAFTTFMALGAWRLMKTGVVVKQMKTVETLGSATVICTDKTGTLTENKMRLTKLYVLSDDAISEAEKVNTDSQKELVQLSMWASEPIPFDPMEVALHESYTKSIEVDERANYKLIKEYPLEGKPPMMTHVFENSLGKKIIAAKGAPEAIIAVSELTSAQIQNITKAIEALASEGYRVLGVGESKISENTFPDKQQNLKFEFKGLVAFYDPPKHNIRNVLESFYKAGIKVKIITGDNAATTSAIAKQIGFKGYDACINGEELMKLSEAELRECVEQKQVFTRMFPEAKFKIIMALKANNEIVAMTGDGVNDGPALKAAHIGIAMGKKGTEIAKQAASLILVEDDLGKMVDAIGAGRKIYTNLKKAIQYIISIHIPIILTVFIPLTLGWIYPNIFSPIHIILLELIMGPTCSIIYENEPMEKNTMEQAPRPFARSFFNMRELITSIIQGLVISLATLSAYVFCVQSGYSEALTRTLVFTVLISANVFLTLVNRSFYYSVLTTLRYKNNLVALILGLTFLLTLLILFVPVLQHFFEFEQPNLGQIMACIALAFAAVMWFEVVKWVRRSYSHVKKE
ncbi:MAG: cation-translocating P-type ATPase [Bacteroidia bacterium]|nr:cation-translocating P-type ATPase [Bacteroidia bacterium]